jgi:hypothetical protein
LWASSPLLSFIAQIVFRRELAPGEFGTLNTALASDRPDDRARCWP